ncbi:uncharacterized protein [Ptychodera flava]|uniref:uncharacterized protein n=1 Tax=Ptychodera flava TaxID=63121 RepID=UPI003969C1C5
MTDAANCGVTLIPAQMDRFSEVEDPKLSWLKYYDIHYPGIRKLENIQYVVGYAPKTGDAAAIIRERLFPGALLVLINHVCPGEKSLLGNENEEQKLSKRMLMLASEADILFFIGPKIHQYFKNQYRVKLNNKQLSDIPHEEILPKPESVFFDIKLTIIPGDTTCNILTYGEHDTPEALNKCHVMAQSIGKAANIRKENYGSIPDWRIQGISPNVKTKDKNELVKKLKSSHLEPKFYQDCSVGALMTTLQQSHLCIPSPCYKDYSLQGLEAMAAGLPTMIEDDSQLACLLTEHFKYHADDCIIHDPQKKLYHNKILGTMSNLTVAFEKANALKKTLQAHEDIFLGSAKLTSLLTDRTLQQTRINSRVQGEKQKTASTSKLGKDVTLEKKQRPQSEASGISATQETQKVQSISHHVTREKAENPRTQNKNASKSDISQQIGTHLQTEKPSHMKHQTKRQQSAFSKKKGTFKEAKKRKQEVSVQPKRMDNESTPLLGRTDLNQRKIKAKLSENTEKDDTSKLQRTGASQSEVSDIDRAQGTHKAQSQSMTSCAVTSHNSQKTMTLSKMIKKGSVSGKCGDTQARKAVKRSSGVETPGEMKSQILTGGELGFLEEEQGSNELKLIFGINQKPFMEEGKPGAEAALTDCRKGLHQNVEEVLADDSGRQVIVETVKDYLGDVDPCDLTADSLGMLLRLPGLYNLYRLKQTCRSTNLAKAFEPLLITYEMRELAAKVGVTLQLKATYDEECFKEIELFFINRDGGGVKPVEVYTHFERKHIQEILCNSDVEVDAMITEETVDKHHTSQTEIDMTVNLVHSSPLEVNVKIGGKADQAGDTGRENDLSIDEPNIQNQDIPNDPNVVDEATALLRATDNRLIELQCQAANVETYGSLFEAMPEKKRKCPKCREAPVDSLILRIDKCLSIDTQRNKTVIAFFTSRERTGL